MNRRGGDHHPEQYRKADNLAARQSLLECIIEVRPAGFFLDRLDWTGVDSVLDLGCGNGNFLGAAGAGGANVVGADLSPGMLAAAAERSTAQLSAADAADLPFADASFDRVMALWMLYHVPDRAAAYAEIERVLRPGGDIAVITNGTRHYEELWEVGQRAAHTVLGRPMTMPRAATTYSVDDMAHELAVWFEDVTVTPYLTRLEIHDAGPALAWFGSIRPELEADEAFDHDAFTDALADEMATATANGPLTVHGLFAFGTGTRR